MEKDILNSLIDIKKQQIEIKNKELKIMEHLYSLSNNNELYSLLRVFNEQYDTLYNDPVNAFDRLRYVSVGDSREADAGRAGQFYVVSTGIISFTANSFIAFQIVNPSNSRKTIQVESIRLDVLNPNISVFIYKNVTAFTSTGTATPQNSNTGSANTSVATVNQALNVTVNPITGGTVVYAFTLRVPIYYELNGSLTIPAGSQAVILIQNNSSAMNISFNMEYWEI